MGYLRTVSATAFPLQENDIAQVDCTGKEEAVNGPVDAPVALVPDFIGLLLEVASLSFQLAGVVALFLEGSVCTHIEKSFRVSVTGCFFNDFIVYNTLNVQCQEEKEIFDGRC